MNNYKKIKLTKNDNWKYLEPEQQFHSSNTENKKQKTAPKYK